MKNKLTTAIFDLDGTLIDSRLGISNGVKSAVEKAGLTMPEGANVRIGPPLREIILEFFPHLEEEKIFEIIKYMREDYHIYDLPVSTPYPYAIELLTELKNRGIKTFIATYKPKILSEQILKLHFDGLYEDIITPTELPSFVDITCNNCSKTDIVRFLLAKHGLKRENTIMVGDSASDIEAGNMNSLVTLAALFGFGTGLDFADYKASTSKEMHDLILELSEQDKFVKTI